MNSFVCAIIGTEAEVGNSKFRQTSVLMYRERVACTENCASNTLHRVNLNPYPLDSEFFKSGKFL